MTAPWMPIALGERGVREIVGAKHNHRVLEYHAETRGRATEDETAWCSAYVNWCFDKAGIMPTRSAAARSWLNWGVALPRPVVGCVVVLSRGPNPAQGHVGFLASLPSGGMVRLLGGNQANHVSIALYPQWRVLGYRWPAGVAVPGA